MKEQKPSQVALKKEPDASAKSAKGDKKGQKTSDETHPDTHDDVPLDTIAEENATDENEEYHHETGSKDQERSRSMKVHGIKKLKMNMPKDQDHIMNCGPLAIVKKKFELAEMTLDEIRVKKLWKNKIKDNEIPRKQLEVNWCDFQQDIINLDPRIQSNEEKLEKAQDSLEINHKLKLEAEIQLARLKEEVEVLTQRRNVLFEKSNRKAVIFLDQQFNDHQVCKISSGKFKSMTELIERHKTLKNSFDFQSKRFLKSHDIFAKVESVKEDMLLYHKNCIADLNDEIFDLKQEYKNLQRQNRALNKRLDKHDMNYTEKCSELTIMENGLNFIFDMLMKSREYIQNQVMRYDTMVDKITAIEDIINTYGSIVDAWVAKCEKSEKSEKSDKAEKSEKSDKKEESERGER